jgi:hypothetical protein
VGIGIIILVASAQCNVNITELFVSVRICVHHWLSFKRFGLPNLSNNEHLCIRQLLPLHSNAYPSTMQNCEECISKSLYFLNDFYIVKYKQAVLDVHRVTVETLFDGLSIASCNNI